MKFGLKKSVLLCFTISIALFLITSCGGGGGGDSDSSDLQTPSADLTGTWTVQETKNGNCQGKTYPDYEQYTASVTQSGNNLTITYTDEDGTSTKNGTISGTSISFSSSNPSDSGGITTVNFSGTVSSNGNSFSGTVTWTWTDGSYTCDGTTNVSATRVS